MKKAIKLNENTLRNIVAESVKKVLKERIDFSNPNWSKDYFDGLTDLSQFDSESEENNIEACYEDISGFLQQDNYLENLSKEYDTDTIYQALMKIAKEYNI